VGILPALKKLFNGTVCSYTRSLMCSLCVYNRRLSDCSLAVNHRGAVDVLHWASCSSHQDLCHQ